MCINIRIWDGMRACNVYEKKDDNVVIEHTMSMDRKMILWICDIHIIAICKRHDDVWDDPIVCMIHDTHDKYKDNDIYDKGKLYMFYV